MVTIKEILKSLEKIPKEEQIEYLQGIIKLITDKDLIKQIQELIEKLKKELNQKPELEQQRFVETPIVQEPTFDFDIDLKYEPKDLPRTPTRTSGLEETVRKTPTETREETKTPEYISAYDSNYAASFERLDRLEMDSLDKLSSAEFDATMQHAQTRGPLIEEDNLRYAPRQEKTSSRFIRPEEESDRFKKYKTRPTNILPTDTIGIIDWKREHDKYYTSKRVDVK